MQHNDAQVSYRRRRGHNERMARTIVVLDTTDARRFGADPLCERRVARGKVRTRTQLLRRLSASKTSK